jgi:hypothetical protein
MDPNEISRQTGTGVLHCLLCVYVDFDLDVLQVAGCWMQVGITYLNSNPVLLYSLKVHVLEV